MPGKKILAYALCYQPVREIIQGLGLGFVCMKYYKNYIRLCILIPRAE